MKTLQKRRREHKTDYGKRLKFLKSGKPRIVFRKTNKYLIAQYIISEDALDKVEIGVNSKELKKFGWPEKASLKSIPAAYLTGLLIGKRIKKEKLEHPIIDFGMIRVLHKTKLFGFLKGLQDAGIEEKHKEDVFPGQERIEGKDLKNKILLSEIKSKIEKENE